MFEARVASYANTDADPYLFFSRLSWTSSLHTGDSWDYGILTVLQLAIDIRPEGPATINLFDLFFVLTLKYRFKNWRIVWTLESFGLTLESFSIGIQVSSGGKKILEEDETPCACSFPKKFSFVASLFLL